MAWAMAKKENHMGFMSKLLSFGSDKDLKRYYKIVDQINGLEPQFEKMTEEELRAQTDKFRERYANGESLDDMLPEAFATVREASKRITGMRHFDVQLIGAMALHEGHIAEMKTGEGKTLVSTLAGYLNAIAGKGVHVVTVNDYLAKRDSEWMGRIYKYLGMTVGLLQNNMPLELKRPAIARAIVTRPKLILADEPTGNLDSKNGKEVMGLLSELHREGTTIVMVTHSQHDAGYADRIIHLFDGHVLGEEEAGLQNL